MRAKRGSVVLGVLLVSALACNMGTGPEDAPDLATTITAQAMTLEAFSTPIEAPTSTPVTGVEVSVTSDTNCRTGPSQAFAIVLKANPGATFKVVGKNTPTGYWIISDPAGGACWLWGQYAVVTGDVGTLPEYPAPAEPQQPTKEPKATKTPEPTSAPTATLGPSAPADPSDFTYVRDCEGWIQGLTPKWREVIGFAWHDNSSNETGFALYRGNTAVLNLPANQESASFTMNYDQGTGGPLFDNFQIVAFNEAGGSFGGAVDVPRCP